MGYTACEISLLFFVGGRKDFDPHSFTLYFFLVFFGRPTVESLGSQCKKLKLSDAVSLEWDLRG